MVAPEVERDRFLAALMVCIERLGGRVVLSLAELNDANEYRALVIEEDIPAGKVMLRVRAAQDEVVSLPMERTN